uniref:Similar to CG8152 n=1 Tax=Papilio xuthus TaxID=66420 RepID=I4DNY1_PAPXU|nr:G patch domain and ankyrin repeat-containing protein 1 homolog [Papilio xuthus]BAM19621.1 similar to CG8152 [Papilio xuthus]
MNRKLYTHFVRPNSPTQRAPALQQSKLSGTEAKKLYLEEVKEVKYPVPAKETYRADKKRGSKRKACTNEIQYCEKELFISVQNNDIDKLVQMIDAFPDKINVCDRFGWSLIMIACQANAVEIVKELLKRGIDLSVRDTAGNSARSLVIKNRNFTLADILLSHKSDEETKEPRKMSNINSMDEYVCDICNNKKFLNKQKHLSSTLHNINASKGRKIPTNFAIPESNKGYQIMLRGGWDKEAGLGPDGSGKVYPVKATKKLDKTGLGHKKKTIETILNEEHEKAKSKNLNARNDHKDRLMEINFRRQFY